MLKLLQEIVDSANEHYFNHQSLINTAFSAQQLNAKLRRLSNQMREMHCINPTDLASSAALVPRLRDIITGTIDFQNSDRTVRPWGDPIASEISDCEADLRSNIAAARKIPVRI